MKKLLKKEIKKNRRMLSEGIIDEGKFMDGLKNILGNIKENLYQFLIIWLKRLKQVVDYVKKL